ARRPQTPGGLKGVLVTSPTVFVEEGVCGGDGTSLERRLAARHGHDGRNGQRTNRQRAPTQPATPAPQSARSAEVIELDPVRQRFGIAKRGRHGCPVLERGGR